jgi:hypothetical protein
VIAELQLHELARNRTVGQHSPGPVTFDGRNQPHYSHAISDRKEAGRRFGSGRDIANSTGWIIFRQRCRARRPFGVLLSDSPHSRKPDM